MKLTRHIRQQAAVQFYARPDFEAEPGAVLDGIIRSLRPGSTLTVPGVAHLATSFRGLKKVLRKLEAKHVRLCPLKVSGNSSELLLDRYRRDLKDACVAAAKARGAYRNCTGRAPSIDRAEVRRLKTEGLSSDEIARRMNCARSSVYYVPKAAP